MLDPQIQALLTNTLKGVVILVNVFYLVLALLVWRQVAEMREQVRTQTSRLIALANLFNLLQVGLVVLVSIAILFI